MTRLQNASLHAIFLGLVLISNAALAENLPASDAAALYSASTTYSIFRKGKKIGKHSLGISKLDNRIEVSVDSKITVRVLKIPVFNFRYVSKEIWENDRLIAVDSTTTTGKDVETASLNNNNNQSLLMYNNTQSTADLIQYATNHWNISAVEQTRLFNTIKGVKSDVSVDFVGKETLNIGGTAVETKHYAYTGDITAQSWYDKNNRWVKLAFLGSDGNQITYLIDNP